jgi:hypothetical protein
LNFFEKVQHTACILAKTQEKQPDERAVHALMQFYAADIS